MLPTDAQRVAPHPAHSPPYQQQHQHQHARGDRKLAFGQLRQAVSSRLCDLLDDAGIHATRVVSGRRFVRWDTVPKLLAQQNAYISALPYEFFFAKTGASTTYNSQQSPAYVNRNHQYGYASASAPLYNEEDENSMEDEMQDAISASSSLPSLHPHLPFSRDDNSLGLGCHPHEDPTAPVTSSSTGNHPENNTPPSIDASLAPTLIARLHAQPLNINILSWKKQTIVYILDGLEKRRIRVVTRPPNRDVVFELELPAAPGTGTEMGAGMGMGTGSGMVMVDIPKWPDVYLHPHANVAPISHAQPPAAFQTHSRNEEERARRGNNSVEVAPPWNDPGVDTSQRHDARRMSDVQGGRMDAMPEYDSHGVHRPEDHAFPSAFGATYYGDVKPRDRDSGDAGFDAEPLPAYVHPVKREEESPTDELMHSAPSSHHYHHHHRHYQGQQAHLHHQHEHQRRGSSSAMMIMDIAPSPSPSSAPPPATTPAPLVHNHTLTPAPVRSYHQGYAHSITSPSESRDSHAGDEQGGQGFQKGYGNGGANGMPSQDILAGAQHVSRPVLHSTSPFSHGNGHGHGAPNSNHTQPVTNTFLTTPTPTKKWTRRSSPDRIFMNVTLNGLLRSAGMPIPRQKDDASRLPWSAIPQFLAENGLYITGWPEANLPWLYSGDMGRTGAGASGSSGAVSKGSASANGGSGTNGIGEWRDRIDWKSSPSQRSYKPLAQALRNGDIRILPRPRGRDVLFEVRDAQGRCYDSTLGLSEEWKARWMQESTASASASTVPVAAVAATAGFSGGEFKFVNLSSQGRGKEVVEGRGQQKHRHRLDIDQANADEEQDQEEQERGRPGYHYRSTSYSRSGSSRTRNTAMDFELPSPTETTTSASTSSGATKRQALSRGYRSPSAFPDISGVPSRVGYQNLAFPSASSSFPPNRFHDAHTHPRRLTPPITNYDREGPSSSSSSSMRFPQLLNRQYSESVMRFQQRPIFPTAESSSNNESCRNTPSPDSSQRQRTVSLGTSSASTGTGTVLSGSSRSSGVSAPAPAPPLHARGGGSGRYNLPSLTHGAIDVDMDLDDPSLNRLPPLRLKPDMEDDGKLPPFPSPSLSPLKRGISASVLPGSALPSLQLPQNATILPSSLPTHLPSPLVAFSQPLWSPTERRWKLTIRDSARASLPPVGDTILWDVERRSWELTWAAADGDSAMDGPGQKLPTALWSPEQEAWILDS